LLLHKKGKTTIAKSKSSRLPCSEVVSLPLESILSKTFRYDADLSDSVMSFIGIYQVDIIVKIIIVGGQDIVDICKCMVEGPEYSVTLRTP
jgi:hypothetical protein